MASAQARVGPSPQNTHGVRSSITIVAVSAASRRRFARSARATSYAWPPSDEDDVEARVRMHVRVGGNADPGVAADEQMTAGKALVDEPLRRAQVRVLAQIERDDADVRARIEKRMAREAGVEPDFRNPARVRVAHRSASQA